MMEEEEQFDSLVQAGLTEAAKIWFPRQDFWEKTLKEDSPEIVQMNKSNSSTEPDPEAEREGQVEVDHIFDSDGIRLHREIINSQIFQNEGLLKVWAWCLISASHQDERRGDLLIRPGQFVYQRKSAAKVLNMGESTTYKRMKKLESMGALNIESDRHFSIVTITNPEVY